MALNHKTVAALTAQAEPVKTYEEGFAAGKIEGIVAERARVRTILIGQGLNAAAILATSARSVAQIQPEILSDVEDPAAPAPSNSGDLVASIVALHSQWRPHR